MASREGLYRFLCSTVSNNPSAISTTGIHWRRIEADDADLPNGTKWKELIAGNITAPRIRFTAAVAMNIVGRSICITQSEKLALCSPNSIAGDGIWVLFGSRVPFVIRKSTRAQAGGTGRQFHFLGDCYLPTVMGGEAVVPYLEGEHIVLV